MDGGYELALRAFDEAWTRYDSARLDTDAQAACITVVEVVVWAVALDDLQARRFEAEHGDGSWWEYGREAADEFGRLLAARWIRNRGVHDVAQLLEVDHRGAEFPIRFPMVFHELRWRAPEAVADWRPEADRRNTGLEQYRGIVGEPARHLLDGLSTLFTSEPFANLSEDR